MNILIKNTVVITMNEEMEIIKKGYVLIKDNIIEKVGKGEYEGNTKNLKVIDGGNYISMPGLINGHTHAAMTLLRGFGEGLPLMRWLNEKIWPMESKFTEDHIRIGTELAVLEMLRTGTTTFNNMYFMEHVTSEVVENMNIRAVLGAPIIGDNWENQLKEANELSKKIDARNSKLLKSVYAPHSPYTLSKEALEVISTEAKKNMKDIHIHIAETEDEINIVKERYNMSPVEFLEKCGVFQNNVMAAHCVHVSDDDLNVFKKNKINVVYNPQSNMKLSSGVAPIYKMNKIGINVSIGTDGTSSNNNLNLIEEMETGALLQKLWFKDATIFDGTDMLKMATINGAKGLNLKKLGMIENGYMADIIMLDMNRSNMMPIHNEYSNIVFSANGSEVSYVIVNGEIVMEKGQFRSIDEEKIIYNCKEVCKRMV